MLLWALLLTLLSQGAGAQTWDDPRDCPPTAWDHPTCTEGVVSVTSGAPAEMTCTISNAFLRVRVCLRAPGREACRPVFARAAPGCSSRGGWRLCVEGGSARMVTEKAQASQAGQYQWTLVGCQKDQSFTYLNVSEPPEQPSTPPWGTQDLPSAQDPLPAQDLHSAQDPPPGRLRVVLILVPMLLLLCILALGGLQCWRGDRGRPLHVQFA
ncbi:secreted and transmembrane protein 1 isoform X2 [Pipistrellus kuhlii]|uniref:secreted and transmembrane protein 1 isoform X2 n=1 Tax=Pipistrellus kuhlii TaxID=59472 RepID=UPI001E270007|nr:secreted and transmembrane protein 1 isoform X2 [Pipistrellus kuhlii]